jgi:F0F1-type ATP synthase assembly protein I
MKYQTLKSSPWFGVSLITIGFIVAMIIIKIIMNYL